MGKGTEKTKNLFDYAKNELSQDAFLMWLFDNYNCEEDCVRDSANTLLKEFGVSTENVDRIRVLGQFKKIDIVVFISYKNYEDGKIALFIEDKKFSEEHDEQLKKYNEIINTLKDEDIKDEDIKIKDIREKIKVYYKTSYMNKREIKTVTEAGWKVCNINGAGENEIDLNEFWKKYVEAHNLILRSYAKHVVGIGKTLQNTVIPSKKGVYLNSWIGYFKNEVVPKLNNDYYWEIYNYRQHYVYLKIMLNTGGEKQPYFEIRSKECGYNKFKARFQIYGVDDNEDIKNKVKEKIENNADSYFRFKNNKREIAETKDYESFSNFAERSLVEFKTIVEAIYAK